MCDDKIISLGIVRLGWPASCGWDPYQRFGRPTGLYLFRRAFSQVGQRRKASSTHKLQHKSQNEAAPRNNRYKTENSKELLPRKMH
jgi:hypothetical protein